MIWLSFENWRTDFHTTREVESVMNSIPPVVFVLK